MNGQMQGAGAQFEIMPFGAGGSAETQLEEERGGMRGGGGRGGGARGGGARGSGARPGARPPPRIPGRPPGRPPRPRTARPVPWTAYPAWPWARWDGPPAVAYAPEPYPEPAPDEEPFDEGTEGEVSDAERAVLGRFPPELRAVLLAMPDAERPRYVSLGMLPRAARNPAAGRAGLYLIVFTTGGRRQAYNGQSSVNVRARLQKHLLGATLLGLRSMVNKHEVFFAQPPAKATPRAIELAINRRMLKPHRGVLTNQRHELEAELLGEAWL